VTASPVRIRTTSSTLVTKIFPSPIRPVRADFSTSSTTWATRSSGTMISILILEGNQPRIPPPVQFGVPLLAAEPLDLGNRHPWTPMSFSDSFTSSSLNGLMIASTFFIGSPLRPPSKQRSYQPGSEPSRRR